MSGGNVTIGQFNTTTTPMAPGDSIAGYKATASTTVRFLATQLNAYIFASTTATTAVAGVAALPTGPVGFVTIQISGVSYKLPYYTV